MHSTIIILGEYRNTGMRDIGPRSRIGDLSADRNIYRTLERLERLQLDTGDD